jgi:hypothetical protein
MDKQSNEMKDEEMMKGCAQTLIQTGLQIPTVLINGSLASQHWVTCIEGTLPIVIAAPHGGLLKPAEIPDRKNGCLEPDTNTHFLAEAIARHIVAQSGGQAHMVLLNLHRGKVDGNRPRHSAVDSVAQDQNLGLKAWDEYHHGILKALRAAVLKFGFAHLFDIHGQSHRVATEAGYLLTNSDLRCVEGAEFEGLAEKSSLGALQKSRRTRRQSSTSSDALLSFEALVRGNESFGGLLEQQQQQQESNFTCVPSPTLQHPCVLRTPHACWEKHPRDAQGGAGGAAGAAWDGVCPPTGGCCYFWGGYSTAKYSSPHWWKAVNELSGGTDVDAKWGQDAVLAKLEGSVVSAMQLETGAGRDSESECDRLGQALALTMLRFVAVHYGSYDGNSGTVSDTGSIFSSTTCHMNAT